ncbi:hypothetical protein B6U99_00905 [Candidatus Geothermarchaeota archaeon ex4572_27]|nr:MAG: hypothetical protein B6U99_00905 [Candidatus Geothermarchaeota archaeon ex4572_27]
MGETFKPEDLFRKVTDVSKIPMPDLSTPPVGFSMQLLIEEVRKLKEEVERIKKALAAHGIRVE